MTDRHLLRKLGLVILLKLFLLAALWWVFIRDERVPVDADRVMRMLVADTTAASEQQGKHDGH